MPRLEDQRMDELPPALPAMWRALKRAYEAEPRLLPVSLGLALLAALPDALLALGMKFLADGVLRHNRKLAMAAAAGLAGPAGPTGFLKAPSERTPVRVPRRRG